MKEEEDLVCCGNLQVCRTSINYFVIYSQLGTASDDSITIPLLVRNFIHSVKIRWFLKHEKSLFICINCSRSAHSQGKRLMCSSDITKIKSEAVQWYNRALYAQNVQNKSVS